MPANAAQVKSLFLAAADLSNPVERDAFLHRECGPDAELRGRVEALLRADARTAGVLESVAVAAAPTPVAPPAVAELFGPARRAAGTVIADRYQLADVIGEGGMGTVFRATQTTPVTRMVALKLIRPGFDSRQVLLRFEAERQALARMDHPNIARLYDGGVTGPVAGPDGRLVGAGGGQPYFVMELVDGVSLTEFCDRKRLSLAARLHLFVSVCQAVQHAHQKGIIHRDLKPSNVLVAELDGTPTPKVIDFGIAKAVDRTLTDASLHDTGLIIGTPAYMSPEQADPTSADIDTRADVYSLGVILYELLAGSPPFDFRPPHAGGLLDALRMIRETDPPRPSTKLDSSEHLPAIAASRSADPAKLPKLLRGELDWIVLKAMEKDRGRRYESGGALARDIERHLADEVVEARPPSRAYRFRKFVRRNRTQVIAAALVVFALVAGVAGTTWQAVRAIDAADGERMAKLDAQEKERLATAAAESEKAAQVEEERQRKYAQGINEFVVRDVLALTGYLGQDRFGAQGLDRNATMLDLLDHSAERLKERKDLDPLIEAELCWIVGLNYRGVGEAAKGVPFLERAVELRRTTLGGDHADTLRALGSLGINYQHAGNLDRALQLLEETLARTKTTLGADHPNTLAAMNNLANCHQESGKLDLAVPLLEQSFEGHKARFGADHPDTLPSMSNLASCYLDAGKPDKARPLMEESLELHKTKLGTTHPDTLGAMNNLAACYWSLRRLDLSIPLFEEALRIQQKKLGREHPHALSTAANLGVNYRDAGRLAEAIPPLEEAHRGAEKVPGLRWVGAELLETYVRAGKSAEIRALARDMAAAARTTQPKGGPQLAGEFARLGLVLLEAKAFDAAEPLFRDSLAIREGKEPDAWTTFNTQSLLGGALLGQKKFADAEPLLVAGYEGMKAREKAIPEPARVRLAEALDRLILLYSAIRKPAEVKKFRELRARYPSEVAPPPRTR